MLVLHLILSVIVISWISYKYYQSIRRERESFDFLSYALVLCFSFFPIVNIFALMVLFATIDRFDLERKITEFIRK